MPISSIDVNVLILEASPIVAQDIILTVSELMPRSKVRIAQDTDLALAQLGANDGFGLALLNHSPRALIDAPLALGLAAQGVPVVVITDEDPESDGFQSLSDWAFLPAPFSTSGLTSAILEALDKKALAKTGT